MKPETMSSKTGPYTVEEVYADGRKNPTYRIVGPTDDNGSSWSLLAMEGECHRLNAAYMAGQESSRWIPVSESLPEEDDKDYLVILLVGKSHEPMVAIGRYLSAKNKIWFDPYVTHWQSLPKAPNT